MDHERCVICKCRQLKMQCDSCEMYISHYSNWICPHCLDVTEKVLRRSRLKILGHDIEDFQNNEERKNYESFKNETVLKDWRLVETKPISLLRHQNSSFIFMQIMDDLLYEIHHNNHFMGIWNNRRMILDSHVKGNMFVLSYDTKISGDVWEREYHPTEKTYNGAIRCFWTIDDGEIEFIWVHPDDRNKGIGSRIVDICLKMGVKRSVYCVESSIPFWEKMGFEYKL